MNETRDFELFASNFDGGQSSAWREGTDFFAENRTLIDKVRNDVGGHFGEAASRHAVEQTDPSTSISVTTESNIQNQKWLSVGFAGDLAATALLRHARGEDPSERARFIFDLLLQGLRYAMDLEFRIVLPFVWHKLGK